MSLIEAIILGIIQGLTEFLPVSSSGHIEIGKALFEIEEKNGLLFTVILHFATALSTIVVFRKEIVRLLKGLFKFRWNEETTYCFKILLSMIPAVLVGLLLKDTIESLFLGNTLLVGSMLLLTGAILFASDKMRTGELKVGKSTALILGVVQAIAILPGISRSGSTIGSALLLGISRENAAKFSFLMVLPLIFGAMAAELKDLDSVSLRSGFDISTALAGFVAAFISGYFACKWMIALVKRSKLSFFAFYCWIVGLLGIFFSLV
jgi:undecaprenyl-diphosphatase